MDMQMLYYKVSCHSTLRDGIAVYDLRNISIGTEWFDDDDDDKYISLL